jgi:hypothetical protein
MIRLCPCALFGALLVLSAGLAGQDPKKEDPKGAKVQQPKRDDPLPKAKGILPMNWGKLGLSDDQRQTIYRIQNKYNDEIDKLEAKIKELKGTRDKEMKAVLTAEQKKRLEDILLGKDR